MKPQAPYWTRKAPPIPEVHDLPPGTFNGTQEQFEQLSPGMRREILRSAQRTKKFSYPWQKGA